MIWNIFTTRLLHRANSHFVKMGKRKDIPASWRPTEVSKNPLSPFFMQEVLLPPYGDNPIDHEMIKKGMKLYNEL